MYVLAILWTSLVYSTGKRVAASAAPAFAPPSTVAISPARRMSLRNYVQNAAKAAGVSPRVAEWIVSHESSHRPGITGDGGESRGLWQINRNWHPEVSDACAYDVRCSTRWSLERIREGHSNEWSTWKYCREKFEDCPF
ncbi:MAG: hypothetical protein ACRD4Y_05250 [Candidatus Acidiferrales bacterium]